MAPILDEITRIQNNVKIPNRIPTYSELMSGYRKIYYNKGPDLLTSINKNTKQLYPSCFGGLNLTATNEVKDVYYNFNVNLDTNPSQCYKPYHKYISRESEGITPESNKLGFSDLTLQHDFSKLLAGSFHAYMKKIDVINLDFILDYYGNDYTCSMSVGNQEQIKTEIAGHLLKRINDKLAIGGEVVIQSGTSNILEGGRVTVAGRYSDFNEKFEVSGAVGNKGAQVCLSKKINNLVSVGSILDYCLDETKLTGSAACQLTHKEFTLRTSVDTNGRLGINLWRNIHSDSKSNINVTLSAITNMARDIKIGVGIDLTV